MLFDVCAATRTVICFQGTLTRGWLWVFRLKGKNVWLPVITKNGGQRSHEIGISGFQIYQVFQEQDFFLSSKLNGMVIRINNSKDRIRDMNCIRIRHCSTLKLKQVWAICSTVYIACLVECWVMWKVIVEAGLYGQVYCYMNLPLIRFALFWCIWSMP